MKNRAAIIIGHMHLTVANLDRSLAFYCDLVGLQRGEQEDEIVTLFPGVHHHIVLEPPHKEAMQDTPYGHTGLYHFSFFYPHRKELARVVKRLIKTEHQIDGAFDYGVTQAVYLRDPDGIQVELYVECGGERKSGQRGSSQEGMIRSITLTRLLEVLQ